MATARKGFLLVFTALLVLLVVAGAALATRPSRVLIVVMDQMRPEYAKQYDMKNVLRLQNRGVNFPKAWVGQLASETVVSHNTMVSGLFPKHMGWSDEAIRDLDGSLGYGENAILEVGALGKADYETLINARDYPKLGDYLHHKYPDRIVANVGQKGYQVESMAASSSDIWVRMGSKYNTADLADPSVVPWTGKYRGPKGNLPDYIQNDPRFLISSGNVSSPAVGPDDYGTRDTSPAWAYPEDGRYAPGPYEGHESGDAWVADAATAIMENEDWSGLFVTFSNIDKIGHMWGGGPVDNLKNYTWTPADLTDTIHMPWTAKNADEQLGKLIAKLKELNQFKDTLIVVTADHGETYGGKGWYGKNAYDGGNSSWYAGTWLPGWDSQYVPNVSAGPDALQPLMDTGKVEFSYQSTAIESWLKMDSRKWGDKLAVARVMKTLPGVIATYVRSGDRYTLVSAARSKMNRAERTWWQAKGQKLVNTMAFSGAADVVGLLADRTLYAAYGDHGGAQKDVQRIPMAIYAKGIHHQVRSTPMRLVDIMPTILKAMGMRQMQKMDGRAIGLPL